MIQSATFRPYRNFSLLLICAMLGACATTQKSSSGAGEQDAAPISDSSSPQGGAKPGGATASPSASAAASGSQANAAKPAGAGAAGGAAAAKQGSSDAGATGAGSDEEAQLKRQLADQDAEINRLREQQAIAEREEAEAARAKEQQAAAAAGAGASSSSQAASTAAASKAAEDAAVFPANAANAATTEASHAESGDAVPPATIERSVYFAYDQAVVADKYDDMLVANASWLKAHPGAKSEVQGNCDERGSREYNLALGARRAQAVKRALELAGADGDRIAAISYGAEKPVATGKDEESYSRNRRADIVY